MPEQARRDGCRQMMDGGEKISPNITLCTDGKYRWTYEVSLYRDPSIFLLVWKILFCIFLLIFSIIFISDFISWGTQHLASNLKFLFWFLTGMTALTLVSYLLYAAIMGGKYRVLFEMDEKGVSHIQLPEQAKKARILSALTVLAGSLARRPATVGIGMNSTRTEMHSEFSRVRRIEPCPRSHVIRLKGLLAHNQVYAGPEDFAFVLDYITSRCPVSK